MHAGLMQLGGTSFVNRGCFENQGRIDDYGSITKTSGAVFMVAEGGTAQMDGRLQANLIVLQGALRKATARLPGRCS